MKYLKTGLVGCGFPFFFHTADAETSKYIKYTAVFDIDYEKACDVAESFSANKMTPYKTLDAMLTSDIEAVIVSVPHFLHEDVVIKCMNAGKHVLCEKPMAITVEGCRLMIEAAKRNKVRLMIAENHRFLPAHNWIHDAIKKGLIGEVMLVRSYEGCNELDALEDVGSWKMDMKKSGGGAFLDQAVHKFAALEYMLGDRVDSVTTILGKQYTVLPEKAEDNAISIVTFKSGILCEITVSCTQINNATNSLEIYGTKGTIMECHDNENPVRIYSMADEAGDMQGEWDIPEIQHGENPTYYFISGRNEDDHFAQCILQKKEFEFTPEDAMSAVECCLTGYLSFVEQRPVKRDEVLKIAETYAGTKSIMKRLEGKIPTRTK